MSTRLAFAALAATLLVTPLARAQDMGGTIDMGAGANGMNMNFNVHGMDGAPAQNAQVQVTSTASSHEEHSETVNGVGFKVAYDPHPNGRTSFRVLAPEGLGVRITDNGRELVRDTVPATVEAKAGHFLRVELFTNDGVVFDHKFEAKAGRMGQLWVRLGAPQANVAMQVNVQAQPMAEPMPQQPMAQPMPAEQPAPAPSPCLADDDFGSVKSAVQAENFSEQKLSVLQSAMQDRRVCVAQVIDLLGLFDFGNDKIAALKMLAPKINDRQNDFKVYSAFTFDSEKDQAKKILH